MSIRASFLTIVSFFGAVIFLLFLTMVIFLPFGQLVGRLMNRFAPLTGYIINILGSLFGIWAFSAMSFVSLPPFYWFLVALLLCLWFLQGRRYLLLGNAAVAGACLALLFLNRGASLWSPYYKIDLDPMTLEGARADEEDVHWGYRLVVNQDYHQKALDLSPEFVGRYEHLSSDVEMAQVASRSIARRSEVIYNGADLWHGSRKPQAMGCPRRWKGPDGSSVSPPKEPTVLSQDLLVGSCIPTTSVMVGQGSDLPAQA